MEYYKEIESIKEYLKEAIDGQGKVADKTQTA